LPLLLSIDVHHNSVFLDLLSYIGYTYCNCVLNVPEVDIINKQKFLAELGRLLTFMYEEDRQTVLSMYGRMFDETADEDGLLELLVSPTRQAVVLARSYDAKARKEQIENGDADFLADPENAPAFIFIIDKTAQQAAELGVKEAPLPEGQFSFFDELPEIEAEPAAVEESAEPVEDIPETEAPEEPDAEPAEEERSSVDETADAVDAFLKDFTIENGELVSLKEEAEEAEEAQPEALELHDAEAEAEAEPAEAAESEAPAKTKLHTNILLLIVYIFLAIPLGLAGIAVLLLPTLFFLGLAVSCAYIGVSTIAMCFTSFAVIADTMAVFGAALALCALALLFVWLFIWFLGGAIVGFIRGICRLGRKLCCKEVAVQ